jgi:hypothetical protein
MLNINGSPEKVKQSAFAQCGVTELKVYFVWNQLLNTLILN